MSLGIQCRTFATCGCLCCLLAPTRSLAVMGHNWTLPMTLCIWSWMYERMVSSYVNYASDWSSSSSSWLHCWMIAPMSFYERWWCIGTDFNFSFFMFCPAVVLYAYWFCAMHFVLTCGRVFDCSFDSSLEKTESSDEANCQIECFLLTFL